MPYQTWGKTLPSFRSCIVYNSLNCYHFCISVYIYTYIIHVRIYLRILFALDSVRGKTAVEHETIQHSLDSSRSETKTENENQDFEVLGNTENTESQDEDTIPKQT